MDVGGGVLEVSLPTGVVQKVTFLSNTDNVTFERFAYDPTDGHPKSVTH